MGVICKDLAKDLGKDVSLLRLADTTIIFLCVYCVKDTIKSDRVDADHKRKYTTGTILDDSIIVHHHRESQG